MTDTNKELQNQVDYYASLISEGFGNKKNEDNEKYNASDFISDALDINFITDRCKKYKSAQICVAFAGPNIWIELENNRVVGYWGADKCTAHFIDNIELDESCESLFDCF